MQERMTVHELIKYLETKDPNAVVLFDYGGTMIPLTTDDLDFKIKKE